MKNPEDFDDMEEEMKKGSSEKENFEKALQKHSKKILRKEDEEKISGDTAEEEGQVSLLKNNLGNLDAFEYMNKLKNNLDKMSSDLSNILEKYGDESYKIKELNILVQEKIDEINSMYENFIQIMITNPPKEKSERTRFFRAQKETVRMVEKKYDELTEEIFETENRIKKLEISTAINEMRAKESYEVFRKIRLILRPGENTWKN